MGKLTDLWTRLTTTRATNLDELGAANLPADIDNIKEMDDGIYFDSVLGSAGTDWPLGTAQNPSNTIADVITMCAARKVKRIYVSGSLTLGATMEDYTFIGRGALWAPLIDLNSQDVDGSSFENCMFSLGNVQGGTGKMYCKNCFFLGITGLKADLKDSTAITAGLADVSQYWDNVTLLNTVDCTNLTAGHTLIITNMHGATAITNLTAGAVIINGTGYAQGAASDNGGTITLYGNIKWDLNGATSTIVDHTIDAKTNYLQNLEDGVYFDSVNGSAGTTWPLGTAQSPSNTISDVITMCAARKTKKIYVVGTLTLGATMEDYIFIARAPLYTTIDLNSQDVDGSYFEGFAFSTATQGGTALMYCKNCYLPNITGLKAKIKDSILGTISSLGDVNQTWDNVALLNTLSCAGFTSSLIITNMHGDLVITDLTAGTVTIDGTGYVLGSGSDTGGTITLYSNIRWGASGTTSAVVDYTIFTRLGAPAGASVSADIAALKTVADAAAADAATAAGHADPDPAGTAAALIAALNNLAAGAQMDLVNAPNATAVTAIQLGLAKTAELISGAAIDFGAVAKASIQAAAQAAITASSLALASNCDAKSSDIKAKTDKITLPVYRQIFKSADSAMLASLAFGSVAADKDFPSVVATAKPTGATVTKAYWGFSYSKKVDSSAGANAVSAASKAVRVKVSTGAWGTDDIVAYTFANGALSTPASATEGGMMIMGSVDIKSVVDGSAATFNFRSEETNRADALTVTGASLTFYDVESWLIIEYTL